MTVASDLLKRAKALFGRSEPEARPAAPKKPAKPYHAVTIAPGPRACAAAEQLLNRRFLSRLAPVLPLKACSNTDCTCRYVHYDDRRDMVRRARDIGASIAGYAGEERRDNPRRGRRTRDT